MNPFLRCLCLQIRILTLTANREELLNLDKDAFLWGLATVWIAGLGRYWDAPSEPMLMRSGLPSVVYIFVLAAFLWVFIGLLRPSNWSYMRLVTFISLTGIPAFLYAIPFEKMYGVEQGAECNAVVLVVVATWRVLMLGNYLIRVTELNILSVTSALMLPLIIIVITLHGFNQLEHVVEVMGGFRYRHVVQIDEKEAIANYLAEKANGTVNPFEKLRKVETKTSQNFSPVAENQKELNGSSGQASGAANQNPAPGNEFHGPSKTAHPIVTEAKSEFESLPRFEKPQPLIVMVEGRPVEFEGAIFHTFRGRNHIVYTQDEDQPIPAGFKEVRTADPEYTPMDPLSAIAYPVLDFCREALMPVGLVFVCSIFYSWFFKDKDKG